MTAALTASPVGDSSVVDEQHTYLAGQQRFVDEVSRVWAQQIESSRSQMDSAVADLTVRFSGIVARLDAMLADSGPANKSSGADGIDQQAAQICAQSESQLNHLAGTLQQAMQGKAEMLGKVQSLQGFLTDLARMAAAISRIAQQTHLLSINAAIEAAHAGGSGAGFAVVAQEVRSLSKLSADTGTDISQTVQTIQLAIRSTLSAADESAKQDQEAMQESTRTIRQVLDNFSGLTQALRDSAEGLRSESRGIKQEIDEAIFQLQFQDRIGQVMSHVKQNIELLPDVQRRNSEACQASGALVPLDAQWLLAELTATYAMAEEHQVHEGAAPVQTPSQNEITFF